MVLPLNAADAPRCLALFHVLGIPIKAERPLPQGRRPADMRRQEPRATLRRSVLIPPPGLR
ncbi:MAG: hypothetical protein WA728_36220, partial [Xanthobacteraceae bacterium]